MTTAAMLGRLFLLLIAAAIFASAVAVWRRQKMAPTRAEFVSLGQTVAAARWARSRWVAVRTVAPGQ